MDTKTLIKMLADHITNVPDFPKKGIQFKDITTLLEQGWAMYQITRKFEEILADKEIEFDKILCPDARGFLFGAALSYATGRPLVLARKPGKLPRPGTSKDYTLEYGTNTLVVSAGSIAKGDRVVIIDDLLATGGSAQAMCDIVAADGGIPVVCLMLIELMDLDGRHIVPSNVISLVKYGVGKREKVRANLEGILDEDQLRYYGTADLEVVSDKGDYLLCGWKYEDRLTSTLIPKNRIKMVIGEDGEEREYLE